MDSLVKKKAQASEILCGDKSFKVLSTSRWCWSHRALSFSTGGLQGKGFPIARRACRADGYSSDGFSAPTFSQLRTAPTTSTMETVLKAAEEQELDLTPLLHAPTCVRLPVPPGACWGPRGLTRGDSAHLVRGPRQRMKWRDSPLLTGRFLVTLWDRTRADTLMPLVRLCQHFNNPTGKQP